MAQEQTKLHKILADATHGITWAVQHPVEAKAIHPYYGATTEDHIEVAEKEIKALVLELIGENPPESEWWRYNGELFAQIQLRAELRKKVEKL